MYHHHMPCIISLTDNSPLRLSIWFLSPKPSLRKLYPERFTPLPTPATQSVAVAVRRVPVAVRRLPVAVRRVPVAVRRLPVAVWRVPVAVRRVN